MGNAREVVCVTGASSQLGVFLLPRLREAGFRVLALGRNAPLRPLDVADRVTWMRTGFLVDGERGDQVVRQPSPDQLVSCGPLDLALRLVLRHPSLQRVVAFSSSSVLSKADSKDHQERGQMAEMAADEEALTVCNESRYGLAAWIFTQSLSRARFLSKKLESYFAASYTHCSHTGFDLEPFRIQFCNFAGDNSETAMPLVYGDFDNDPYTMNSILGTVLGRRAGKPFTPKELQY